MPHVLEISDVVRILAEAKKDGEVEWLLAAVALIHALRSSEAVAIMPANIADGKLTMKRLKKSNPVNDELLEHANPLLNERQALIDLALKTPKNQKLFPISSRTFQRWMHRWGKRAGLPELYCHPHTLKHSILSYLAETMSLPELKDRSGHKSLGSLGVYLHPKKAVVDAKVREAFRVLAV